MIRRIALLLVLAFVGATEGLHAQRFAVSANLPALLTGTISVEPSVALGDRTSLQLSFSARPGLFKLPMPVVSSTPSIAIREVSASASV